MIVEFIDENGGGPGVRLPKAPTEEELGQNKPNLINPIVRSNRTSPPT